MENIADYLEQDGIPLIGSNAFPISIADTSYKVSFKMLTANRYSFSVSEGHTDTPLVDLPLKLYKQLITKLKNWSPSFYKSRFGNQLVAHLDGIATNSTGISERYIETVDVQAEHKSLTLELESGEYIDISACLTIRDINDGASSYDISVQLSLINGWADELPSQLLFNELGKCFQLFQQGRFRLQSNNAFFHGFSRYDLTCSDIVFIAKCQ